MNFMSRYLFLYILVLLGSCSSPTSRQEEQGGNNSGMKLVPGGEFIMGTDEEESYPHERPAHHVNVKAFWIDETEVTNTQFDEFVKATGYVTVAEKKPTWEELKKQVPPGTPQPPDSVLVPGSLVFDPPENPVSLD